MTLPDECPTCAGVEIRLIYKRSSDGQDEWTGKCWDCRNEWTASRDDGLRVVS